MINFVISIIVLDLTNASGISMKQYEEQLNGLRKENFHLKLRIYFLEEKLGSGSPPAVQVSCLIHASLSISSSMTFLANHAIAT